MNAVDTGRAALTRRLHLRLALITVWLVATSPWIALYRSVPDDPGLLTLGHVFFGFVGLAYAAIYGYACMRAGRWRQYFPWLAGQGGAAAREFAGLLRGRIPTAEGGGLFAVIEGLALLLLLVTALSGAAWFLAQGTGDALLWRGGHVVAARALIAVVVAHAITVSLHLLEF